MNKTLSLASLVIAVSALSACASKVELDDAGKKPVPIESRGTQGSGATTDPRGVEPVTAQSIDPLNDPKGVLAKRSIYFDFDSFEIKPEFRATLEAHAKYLRDNKSRKISLEGNTDERGTREYNLALGQKRAEAVKRALTVLGVAESQLEAVSLGEEKPRAAGHDEAAWTENRRVDLRYL
ncbi:MAG TPA: peptidoglycan-associated lipoprotein Pal [Burkholderiaceae bacterium]|nr:peptidoglycan-associated lipoprotein Pal [Burkholderiaceae bacterium]